MKRERKTGPGALPETGFSPIGAKNRERGIVTVAR